MVTIKTLKFYLVKLFLNHVPLNQNCGLLRIEAFPELSICLTLGRCGNVNHPQQSGKQCEAREGAATPFRGGFSLCFLIHHNQALLVLSIISVSFQSSGPRRWTPRWRPLDLVSVWFIWAWVWNVLSLYFQDVGINCIMLKVRKGGREQYILKVEHPSGVGKEVIS